MRRSLGPGIIVGLALVFALGSVLACSPKATATPTLPPATSTPTKAAVTPTSTPTVAATPTTAATATATRASATGTAAATPGVTASPSGAGENAYMMKATAANAKKGGQLVLAAHGPPAHFDFYASGTIANLGAQGPMYSKLVRRDPRDASLPIIGDLAYKWDIPADGSSYTFYLRQGVKFHDGAELTADDVKASFDRQIFPASGLVSTRQALFNAISEVKVVDKYTVQFKLNDTRSTTYMMKVFAFGWSLVVEKKTLDANNGNLRQVDNHPGTGPFMYGSRDDQQWTLKKNPNYWNPDVPYVDQIRQVWLRAWTPELAAALLGGQVDWGMWLDPKTGRDVMANKYPNIQGIIQRNPVGAAVGYNNSREPFTNVKVRQAFNLVIDKPAIVQANFDIKGFNSPGGWFPIGTQYAIPPQELLAKPGYRSPTAEDIANAQKLLSDAGFAGGKGIKTLDYLVRDSPNDKIEAAAVQAMLQERLGVQTTLRVAQVSVHGEDQTKGNYDMTTNTGWGNLLDDPASYLFNNLGSCGNDPCAGNVVRYKNPQFEALALQFARETDDAKRAAVARQIHDLLDQDVPMSVYSSGEDIYWGWQNYVKGVTPGNFTASYDLHTWDQVWLDK